MEFPLFNDGLDLSEQFLRLSLAVSVPNRPGVLPAAAGITQKRKRNEEEDEASLLVLNAKRIRNAKQRSENVNSITNPRFAVGNATDLNLSTGLEALPSPISAKRRRTEEEDEASLLALKAKKIKNTQQGIKNVKSIANPRLVGGNATDSNISVGLEAFPSKFHVSRWSGIAWHAVFVLRHYPPGNHSANHTTNLTPRNDGPLANKLQLISSSFSLSTSLRMSEDHNLPNANAYHFVSALQIFNDIIPKCDAIEWIRLQPTWCLANKDDSSRCRWNIPPQTTHSVERINKLLTDLAAIDVNNTVSRPRWVIQLAKLINLAVCIHHREHIRDEVRKFALPLSKEAVEVQIEETKKYHAPMANSSSKITYWLRELPTTVSRYLPEFLPYMAPGSSNVSSNEWVKIQVNKPLSRKDLEFSQGYLYIYWNQATFGTWKIGCTTRDVDLRISEWEDECKHIAEELYRSPVKVNNVMKVEKLMHAALKDYRVFEPACHHCLKSHNEWFTNVDFAVILEKIEFWTQWISKEPYDESGILKKDAAKDLPQLNSMSAANFRKNKERLIARTQPGGAVKRLTWRRSPRTTYWSR